MTDRQIELRWLRRATAVPAVARKNGLGTLYFSLSAAYPSGPTVAPAITLLQRFKYHFLPTAGVYWRLTEWLMDHWQSEHR